MWRAGFHPRDAHTWYDVAFQALGIGRVPGMHADEVARLASMWRATGMSEELARAWVDQPVAFADPFSEPQAAMRWSQGGFTPDEAARWHGGDWCHTAFTPDVAAGFHQAGWDPSEASLLFTFAARLPDAEDTVQWSARWVETGLSAVDVLDFARAGVTPQEGPVLARWTNKDHLREELEARESQLDNLLQDQQRASPPSNASCSAATRSSDPTASFSRHTRTGSLRPTKTETASSSAKTGSVPAPAPLASVTSRTAGKSGGLSVQSAGSPGWAALAPSTSTTTICCNAPEGGSTANGRPPVVRGRAPWACRQPRKLDHQEHSPGRPTHQCHSAACGRGHGLGLGTWLASNGSMCPAASGGRGLTGLPHFRS